MKEISDPKSRMLFKIAEKKKNQILFFIFASLSLFTMLAIFLFSSQPAEYSAELSGKVGSIVEKFLFIFKWILNDTAILWVRTYIRKIAHFTLYAILGGFLLATFLNTKIKKRLLKISYSAIIGLIYSITDEIHQLFIVGRSGQISDVLLDFCGVIFGIFACLLVCRTIKLIAKRGKKSKA